ncbi:hypothetical protein MKD33_05050, partial [Chromobacterium piscinae]
MQNTEPAL